MNCEMIFSQSYRRDPVEVAFCPYRVCPIGAHVDHQHGLVTGFAFNMGVDLWFNPVEDGRVSLKSLTFEGSVDFDVTKPTQVKEGNWGDYARGAKYALKKRFVPCPRFWKMPVLPADQISHGKRSI